MRIRFMSICFLVLVLLNGAMGGALAAALCPHVSGAMACCLAQKAQKHDHMAGIQMGDMESEVPSAAEPQGQESVAVGQPMESCSHCMTHSQTVVVPVLLHQVDHKNDQAVAEAPAAIAWPVTLAPACLQLISARPHAPPGPGNRRYILLSVFRI
jgi:hypothetical protein